MSAIKTYTAETLAEEIKAAVEWLKEEDCGCVTLKLNGTLAVCVGWSDGFDPDDETNQNVTGAKKQDSAHSTKFFKKTNKKEKTNYETQ